MYAKKNSGKKMFVAMLAIALLIGCTIGGTIAWLMDSTDAVVNTFSPSDIEITLTETFNTDTNNDNKLDAWQQEMVPGKEYDKNPVVAVDGTKTDIDCYLFVRFVEEGNPSAYLTYTSTLTTANGWTQVPGTTGVWYRIVNVADSTKEWHLLDGDKITVKGDAVTKENMATASQAKLTYEAYAIQTVGFEDNPAGAWTKAYAQKPATNP